MDDRRDRRVRRTRASLRQALLSLVQEKGYEALSVQEIIDRANVGRATFYSHFDSKEDLLASGFDELRETLRQRQREGRSRRNAEDRSFAFSYEMFSHANEHREIFRSMAGKHSGTVVQHSLHKILIELIRDDVKEMLPKVDLRSARVEALVQYLAGGMFGILMWWIQGKMRLPVEEVDVLFRRLAVPAVAGWKRVE